MFQNINMYIEFHNSCFFGELAQKDSNLPLKRSALKMVVRFIMKIGSSVSNVQYGGVCVCVRELGCIE